MIRQYRIFMARVFLILLYVKIRSGATLQDIVNFTSGLAEDNDKVSRCNYHLLSRTSGLSNVSIDEMLEELADQLLQPTDAFKDGDLIDTIVQVLGLPYVKNTVNSKTVADLRRALLLPSEMALLGERLQQRELGCASCKHTFYDSELVTISRDGGDTVIYCAKCCNPSYISCSKCERTTNLSKKLAKVLSEGANCGNHSGVEEPKKAESKDEAYPHIEIRPAQGGEAQDHWARYLAATGQIVQAPPAPAPPNMNAARFFYSPIMGPLNANEITAFTVNETAQDPERSAGGPTREQTEADEITAAPTEAVYERLLPGTRNGPR